MEDGVGWRVLLAFVTLVTAFVLSKIITSTALRWNTWAQPGFWSVLRPSRDLAVLLGVPHRRWLNNQEIDFFKCRFEWFKEFNSTVIGIRSLFPIKYTVQVGDPAAIAYLFSPAADNVTVVQEVTQELNLTTFIDYNVLGSEGEVWKRHRLNAAKAFTNKNVQLVWDVTQTTLAGCFRELAQKADATGSTFVEDAGLLAIDIATDILLESAFGMPVKWTDHTSGERNVPEGHVMDFRTALEESMVGIFHKALLPDWVLRLWPAGRRIRLCYQEYESYLNEMVALRRKERGDGAEHNDLLSCLIEGSDSERPERKLSESELISNLFVFQLAGHETTARSMTFALHLLAMFPEVQERCFQEALEVLPESIDSLSAMKVLADLPLCKGVAYETLRIFPPAVQARRTALQDFTLPCSSVPASADEPATSGSFFVPKGSHINMSLTGLQVNPTCWPDPYAFKPERHGNEPPHPNHFRPFGGGSRVCIGMRVAVIELQAVVAHVVRHYKISLPPNRQQDFVLRPGETERERYDRFFEFDVFITLEHQKSGLVFSPRV